VGAEVTKLGAFERNAARAFADAIDGVFGTATLTDAMRLVGLDPLPQFKAPGWSTLAPDSVEWEAFRPESRVLLAASQLEHRGRRVTLANAMASSRVTLGADVQEEIGIPGTRYTRGVQQTEQNTLLRPFSVRGSSGNRALYDEAWRTDTGIFRHVNEHSAITCSASYEPQDSPGMDDETREIMKRGHAALMNVRGGFRRVKRHWATSIREGFAVSEVVWGVKPDGFICPVMIEPREAATVQGWVFDEHRRSLAGAEFQSFGDGRAVRYALPAGETPLTCRMVNVRLNATGNEMEGVPPLRPVIQLRKMKELILQCAGIAFQKHGVPIATVSLALVDATIAELGRVGTPEHRAELNKLLTRLKDIRSKVGPVLQVPVGASVDYVVPTNGMPDSRPLLEWIDLAIAQAFANEGAMLGSGGGSYALAEAKMAGFMRSAPAYAESFTEVLEQLMRVIIKANHSNPDSITEFPRYAARFAGTQDSTRWINDLATAQNAGVGSMPAPVQRAVEDRLGLPAGSLAQGMPEAGNAGQPAVVEPTPDGRSSDERANANKDNRAV
jgi:hypothetical protein